jgi:D-arabinose 5-phosphate isomerase GutQ
MNGGKQLDFSGIRESVLDTLKMESDAILELRSAYDEDSLERVVAAITGCAGTTFISGCGTSGEAAKKIAHTLSCIECPSMFLSPSDALHGGLGAVRAGDIAILISKGGKSREINEIIAPSRAKKALIIGVSETEDSVLAKGSDIFLKVRVSREPDDFDMLATSSTLAVIALFDAIAIAIMRTRGYTKERFAMIHPGGAVGQRLKGAGV